MIKAKTLQELQDVIEGNEKVVVIFSAPAWCRPCVALHPHAMAADEKLPNVTFVEVDIDQAEDIRKEYEVMSVPTVLAYQGGLPLGPVNARTAPGLVKELS